METKVATDEHVIDGRLYSLDLSGVLLNKNYCGPLWLREFGAFAG
jgi:hypothetical protein